MNLKVRLITSASQSELDIMVRKAMQTVLETLPEVQGSESAAKQIFPNFDFESMKTMFQGAVANPMYRFIFVEDGAGNFAGHSIFSIKTDDKGKIYCSHYTRFVEPLFRRRGIGEMLLAEAESWARQMSAEYMLAQTHVTNVALQGLFMKCGFVRTGPVQGPYLRYDLRKDIL